MLIDSLLSTLLQALFFITMLAFVIYSLCLAYHWFSYGTSKATSLLTTAVYLIVSAPLFLTMAIILQVL